MIFEISTILYLLTTFVFICTIAFHLIKKNSTLVFIYLAQSVAVAAILFIFSFEEKSLGLLISAGAMLIVKTIIAPMFLLRLIKIHQLIFSASTYLNAPLTLLTVMLISAFARSGTFAPLAVFVPETKQALFMALSVVFASLFLTINRRGAMSQIVGILSLENGIVCFMSLIGLRETVGLELGIIFDILVWIIIAAAFLTMIYKKFGSANIDQLKSLKD